MPPTGDSQELSPLVDAGGSVGVHRAVNGDSWNTRTQGQWLAVGLETPMVFRGAF